MPKNRNADIANYMQWLEESKLIKNAKFKHAKKFPYWWGNHVKNYRSESVEFSNLSVGVFDKEGNMVLDVADTDPELVVDIKLIPIGIKQRMKRRLLKKRGGKTEKRKRHMDVEGNQEKDQQTIDEMFKGL